MSDLMNLIQEADLLMLDWENSKSDLDAAKVALELAKEKADAAKQRFEAVLAGADAHGIPRAKLRKLVEERSQSLVASGLFSVPANGPAKAAAPKAVKPKKKAAAEKTEDVTEEEMPLVSEADFGDEGAGAHA